MCLGSSAVLLYARGADLSVEASAGFVEDREVLARFRLHAIFPSSR